jgi:hypothetical protein
METCEVTITKMLKNNIVCFLCFCLPLGFPRAPRVNPINLLLCANLEMCLVRGISIKIFTGLTMEPLGNLREKGNMRANIYKNAENAVIILFVILLIYYLSSVSGFGWDGSHQFII